MQGHFGEAKKEETHW